MQDWKLKCFVLISLVAGCQCENLGYSYQQPSYSALQQFYGLPHSYVMPESLGLSSSYPGYQHSYMPPLRSESYNKEFYTFSAPEEDFQDVNAAQQVSAALQKNLRVIFIKSPENRGLEQAALAVAKHNSEDRTAIFVLNKQTDVGDFANRLAALREQRTHKPEVHFVKYRTAEEAAHAQHYIQAQYDTLEGKTTANSNEGIAPVLNFASKSPSVSTGGNTDSYEGALYGGLTGVGGHIGSAVYGGHVGSFANGFGDGVANIGSAALEGTQYESRPEFSGYGVDPRQSSSYADNIVSKLNERISTGSTFVFPTEAAPTQSYLPPLHRKR